MSFIEGFCEEMEKNANWMQGVGKFVSTQAGKLGGKLGEMSQGLKFGTKGEKALMGASQKLTEVQNAGVTTAGAESLGRKALIGGGIGFGGAGAGYAMGRRSERNQAQRYGRLY